MSLNKTTLMIVVIGCVSFCAFVLFFEHHTVHKSRSRVEEHARVIADALWNFNPKGSLEYLDLACRSHNYERLVVRDTTGRVFQEVSAAGPAGLTRALEIVGLIPRLRLTSEVVYRGENIGSIEAVWRSRTLYLYAYVLFALILTVTVFHLYTRILQSKQVLEERVHERTAELADLNASLKQEISERMQAEDAFRRSEAKYRDLVRTANSIILRIDTQGRVTFFNEFAQRFFGFTEEEILGRNVVGTIVPEVDTSGLDLAAMVQDVIIHPDMYVNHENENMTRDGKRVWVAWANKSVRDEEGRIVEILCIGNDFTERKRAEESLQQSEERYRSLVENTLEGYFICELPTGKVLFLNQTLCFLLGYTMEDALRLTIWDVVASEDRDRVMERIEDRLENRVLRAERRTYACLKKDGTRFLAEVSTSLVTFRGRPSIQGVLRDITEQEDLQRQLRQAQRMEAIGTLAGGIAHDFNNLLMGIQGRASLMLMDGDPAHPHMEHILGINEYVRSAADLTRQLLGFARAGKYEVKATDLNELITKTAEMFGRTKKEIRIRRKYQENVWTVEVDRGQIEQVLLNLYVNAWQAMPAGGDLHISTENIETGEDNPGPIGAGPGRYVKISVRDTGVGMDEPTQQRIFDPFFTTKGMGRGTGLGLASAYGIVNNHGGVIKVRSERGKGSTFDIYLPVSEKGVAKEVRREAEVLKGSGTALLVDDEEIILEVGSEMLSRLGYRTLVAKSGKEALDIYEKSGEGIDIVILDMIMPEMGGGDAYDRLKEMDPEAVVLLSSGYSIDGKASAILKRGCNGFIQKPFDMTELSRKMKQILDKA